MRPVTSTWDWFREMYTVHPTVCNGPIQGPYQHWPWQSKDPRRLSYFLQTDKMKQWLSCICALTVVAFSVAQQYQQFSPAQQQFINRYDNFNADSIIQNDRILLAYYKCVMEKGPCTKDGKNFKRVLPETLQSACGRCSPKQKDVVRKMLLGIRAKSEPRFTELLEKYDPTQVNREALYAFLVTGN